MRRRPLRSSLSRTRGGDGMGIYVVYDYCGTVLHLSCSESVILSQSTGLGLHPGTPITERDPVWMRR